MKAKEIPVTKFLQGTQQFLIPIYQRTYSWTEKQCEQLWDDIINAIENDTPSHFLGSVVYIEEGLYQVSDVSQLSVIDGQQRLATLTLLFAALAKKAMSRVDTEIIPQKIQNYFLFNNNENGDKRYKLVLTQSDNDTLQAIIENKPIPKNHSENLVDNFEYFQNVISKSKFDLDTIYRGINKLIIVDISLDKVNDKPQLIFESLNSTGLELSQTDLIRNYILMELDREKQNKIYKDYWHPMEKDFGDSQKFDDFIRDYLTIKTGQIANIRDVYSSFKEYYPKPLLEKIISEIHYYAKFYTRLVFEIEQDKKLNQIIHNINTLKSDVTYPFLLEVYVDYDQNKISQKEILEIFEMVESYVFRRAICDIPTNSLNKTFASLADQIDKEQYMESLRAIFYLKTGYRRFPTNKEFAGSFIRKDVYNKTRVRKHLLERLENHDRKEEINVDDYTIEHIMPQTLSDKWKNDLGPDWKDIHEKYLHTIGNLTLTGYNSELSDKSFLEKRNMGGGFADSPIRLNADLAKQEHWGESEIIERSKRLAEKSASIWKYPHITQESLEKYSVDDDDDDDDDMPSKWESNLKLASDQVRYNIEYLVSQVHQKFDCIMLPYSYWLAFYVRKPIGTKTRFFVLNCKKNTANVMFRINPDTFKEDENIRKVAGWFFPRGTERRIRITSENIPQILSLLEHSYNTTI